MDGQSKRVKDDSDLMRDRWILLCWLSVILGCFLSLVSFFLPYVKSSDGNKVLYQIVFNIFQGNYWTLFLIWILFYPYIFMLALLLFHGFRSFGVEVGMIVVRGKFLERWFRKFGIFLIKYLGVMVNTFIYLGYYNSPGHGFWLKVLGLILMGVMIYGSYYFYERGVNFWGGVMGVLINNSLLGLIYVIMLMVIFQRNGLSLEVGVMIHGLGLGLIFLGLSLEKLWFLWMKRDGWKKDGWKKDGWKRDGWKGR